MNDIEQRLRNVVEKIANEQGYEHNVTKIEAVNSGGANYTSRLFAVTVTTPGKQDLKLFSKVAMIGENIRAMSQIQMFEVETIFYTKLLTKYRELEERFRIPDSERLVFAKYYGGTVEYMKEMIMLEDLTAQGYHVLDRLQCYDWQYAADCVSMLAKLHALSVAYEKDDPDDYARMCKTLTFNYMVNENIMGYHKHCVEAAVKATEDMYKSRVETFLQRHLQENKTQKYFNPDRKVLLMHGDFRPSNILQKVEKDGIRKLVLVDHQLVQLGNPTTDLLYFLISGSDEEFRAKHLQQYFDHYYEELRKSLSRFQIAIDQVYKKEHYEEDVKQLLPFGLTLGAFTLPIITVDASKAPKEEVEIDFQDLQMEVSDLFPIRFNGLVRDYIRMGIL